jgi:hypothetical protein
MGKGIKKTQVESKRSFGGKVNDFKSNAEHNHEKKHLKAYLKGKKMFVNGFKTIGTEERNMRIPAWFEVKETWN